MLPRQARQELSSTDFTELAAYYAHEPFGWQALNELIARIGVRVLRTLGDSKTTEEDLLAAPYELAERDREPEDLDTDDAIVQADQARFLDEPPTRGATLRHHESLED